MKIKKLSKKAYAVKNGAVRFLNGLTSNDMGKPQNAFLNIHGRIIATFDQLVLNEDEVLIVIEDGFADLTLGHLDRYCKLSGVKIEPKSWKIYFDLCGDVAVEADDHLITQKKGRLLVTSRDLSSNVTDEEFTLFRLQNGIPWIGIDYRDEMLLNVSESDFVSFVKGCYLGQEPISKVHSRSRPARKLVVQFEDECTDDEKAKMTSKSVDPATSRLLGFVFVSNK